MSLSDEGRRRTNVANFRCPISDKCCCWTNVPVGRVLRYRDQDTRAVKVTSRDLSLASDFVKAKPPTLKVLP